MKLLCYCLSRFLDYDYGAVDELRDKEEIKAAEMCSFESSSKLRHLGTHLFKIR